MPVGANKPPKKPSVLQTEGMKLIGAAHVALGSTIVCLQLLAALISWVYQDHHLFEDFFQPGYWLGMPILLLGILCLCQHRYHHRALYALILCYSVVILMLCIFFMSFKIRWILHDPELSVFEDCSAPRWPKTFMLDDMPHCNAFKMNNSVGQAMIAMASADIIVCLVGIVVFIRFGFEQLKTDRSMDGRLLPESVHSLV